jgi:hypothetical protein
VIAAAQAAPETGLRQQSLLPGKIAEASLRTRAEVLDDLGCRKAAEPRAIDVVET